jgi:iron complex outermembrane receptor protein
VRAIKVHRAIHLKRGLRAVLLGCASLGPVLLAPAARAATDDGATLAEIVVTAQKRAQSLQDVPVAVTALTEQALQTNRVTNVQDLNNLVPNLSVRPTPGGIGIPSFTMRGITSYGVVPGSDKEISTYIDGVYIGSTRGSLFDFPDIQRVEVLRGPQGTLFGRNATAGAISVITPNPSGQFGVRQELGYGNYDQFRARTRIELPQWGPLSGYLAYLHDQRRGDIKNLGAGMTWTRPGVGQGLDAVQTSPNYLGDKDLNAVLTAVRFAPNDALDLVYKFDWAVNHGTPEGVAPVAAGSLVAPLLAFQPRPVVFDTTARRPDAVNNWWSTPSISRNWGHNITAQLRISDQLSLKNILAYRYSFTYASYEYSGLGGLTLGGAPFETIALTQVAESKQWSDELQLNYESKPLTLTAGAMYFHLYTLSGQPRGFAPPQFKSYPGGLIPPVNPPVGLSYNYSTSMAAYVQAEAHVTPELDLVGGYRLTSDDKTGTLYNPNPIGFTYNKAKPSYVAGVNYKPAQDILLYGKYSTGFVSGGAVGVIAFQPETAHSWEAGLKADLLNRRLRTNLAVFDVKYQDIQSAQSGLAVGHPELSTLIVDLGAAKAQGFELEVTALPMRGLTLGASLGYTDFKYTSLTPLAVSLFGPDYRVGLLPTWTSLLSADYVTQPLFGEAQLHASFDASYHSKQRFAQDNQVLTPGFEVLRFGPAVWNLNARVALERINLDGADIDVGIWARNLTNDDSPLFANVTQPIFGSTSLVPARTFGVDIILRH